MNEQEQVKVVSAPAGITTSQGQFTALFSLVCVVLAFMGVNTTPEQITGWLEFVESLAKIIVPIVSAAGVLITYTNSRGKIESNTLWANASIEAAQTAGTAGVAAVQGIKSGNIAQQDWKDPRVYVDIARTADHLGVPKVGKVLDVFGEEEVDFLKALFRKFKDRDDDDNPTDKPTQ